MELNLQPEVLRWARQRAGYDVETLARRVKTSVRRVEEWESTGKLRPKQAENLAHVTHTPIGYLYLPAPPEERLPIPDFRTFTDHSVRRPSPDLLDVIDQARIMQDWFRDYLISAEEDRVSWIGTLARASSPIEAAARIRAVMGLDSTLRQRARTWEEALRLQIEQIEEHGVMVLRSGIVGANTHRPLDVEEFRGFVLVDDYAPLIFINGADTLGAQMFTLMHELVHVWVGESGVSNLEYSYADGHDTERRCNQVAAELLVPTGELRELWPEARTKVDPEDWLTRRFKVSRVVVLRRLRDIGVLSFEEFMRKYEDQQERFRALRGESSGGDYYRTQKVRTGARFARAVIESTLEGRTPYRDALRLLNMSRVETFEKFARELRFDV